MMLVEGFKTLLFLFQNDVAPLPSANTVEGSTLFIRVLSFLDEMAKDQVLNDISQSLPVLS